MREKLLRRKKKVFCKNCVHLNEHRTFFSCMDRMRTFYSYYKEYESEVYDKPADKNRNNDCKDYKEIQ